jgi:type IV pilus assembly protein PilM
VYRLYNKSKVGVIGVDISSTSVKLLELSVKNDRYWIENYALIPFLEGSVIEKNILNMEAVGDAIAKAVGMVDFRSQQAAMAIPTSMVITKIIEMDANMQDDDREIQIRMDAEQYIPFPLDDVSLDFEVLPDRLPQSNRVNVLLVVTRVENVEVRRESIELGGLVPKIADVENFAIENAFQLFADTVPKGTKTIAILDIGHTMTILSVLQNNKIIYNREQIFGGKQLTHEIQKHYGLSFEEAGRAKKFNSLPDDYESQVLAPFLDAVIQQAARSLQFFFSSSQYHDIDHIILAGGCANIPGLAKLLQQKLNYRVTIANPLLHMGFSPRVDAQKIKSDAPSLMVACGLALRSFD